MTQVHSDLIYDIGLFDGDDTAYYLYRDYNVIAVEANPLMVDRAKLRFAKEIEQKRLTILNVGVSENQGTATFWISDKPEWSSFDKTIASRDGTAHNPISVSILPFSHILNTYGAPHYLKIDIEGNDKLCVESLSNFPLPRFVSVESECLGDSDVISDEEAIAMLVLLRDVGYKKFKLVNQLGWTSVRSNRAEQILLRVADSAARGRLKSLGLSRIARKFTDSTRTETLGFPFSTGSSGPFGDDLPGHWMPFDSARSTYLRERRSFFSRKRELYAFWYDWHATY